MNRFPSWVYREGEEPDARFSLANERTFLAWIRTALALLAAGVGLESLHIPSNDGIRVVAAGLLLVLGMVAAGQAWIGWARTERSLRLGRALPARSLGGIIAFGLLAVAVLILVGSR